MFKRRIILSLIIISLFTLAVVVPIFAQNTQPTFYFDDPCVKQIRDAKGIMLQVKIPDLLTPSVIQKCTRNDLRKFENGKLVSDPREVQYVKNIQAYVSMIYNFLIGGLALAAIVMLMIGGFQWVVAAGNQSRIGQAKSTIGGALGGLVLVLVSYVLLNTINPQIPNLTFESPVDVEKIVSAVYCADAPDSDIDPNTDLKTVVVGGQDKKKDKTVCGQQYKIPGRSNDPAGVCLGRKCDPGEGCLQGQCKKGLIYGTQIDHNGTEFIEDYLEFWAVCPNNTPSFTTGGYSKAKRISNILHLRIARVDIPDAAAQKLGYVLPSATGSNSISSTLCGGLKPVGFYLKAEINDPAGVDDWFALDKNCGAQEPLFTCKKSGMYNANGCTGAGDEKITNPDDIKWLSIVNNPSLLIPYANVKAGGYLCNIKIDSKFTR